MEIREDSGNINTTPMTPQEQLEVVSEKLIMIGLTDALVEVPPAVRIFDPNMDTNESYFYILFRLLGVLNRKSSSLETVATIDDKEYTVDELCMALIQQASCAPADVKYWPSNSVNLVIARVTQLLHSVRSFMHNGSFDVSFDMDVRCRLAWLKTREGQMSSFDAIIGHGIIRNAIPLVLSFAYSAMIEQVNFLYERTTPATVTMLALAARHREYVCRAMIYLCEQLDALHTKDEIEDMDVNRRNSILGTQQPMFGYKPNTTPQAYRIPSDTIAGIYVPKSVVNHMEITKEVCYILLPNDTGFETLMSVYDMNYFTHRDTWAPKYVIGTMLRKVYLDQRQKQTFGSQLSEWIENMPYSP